MLALTRKHKTLAKIKKHLPPSSAITYNAHELPYHNPPIIYKLDGSDKLFSRKNTWGSDEEFIKYYTTHGTYPETGTL
jgi:hypothetical protein